MLKYKDNKTAGQLAVEYGVAVGELGCPHCGIIVHGAIYSPICALCNKDMFCVLINREN